MDEEKPKIVLPQNNHSLYIGNDLDCPSIAGRYLIELKLSEQFVNYCKHIELSDQERQLLERRGNEALLNHGFKLWEGHIFYHWFGTSAMIHHIRFPYGNATGMAIEGHGYDISLHPHNVDTLEQRDCLAELVSHWTRFMDYKVIDSLLR